MSEQPNERQCGRCYFCRDLAGTLQCLRNPPALDLATGAARWPSVLATDVCGAFRHADGNPLTSDRWPRNDVPIYHDDFGDYCRIPLTQGRFAKVDPEDYLWLAQFRWAAKMQPHAVYAVRTVEADGRTQQIFMHREIMDTPDDMLCDHVNHDGSDNRKANLRNCTYSQNNANRRSSPNASSKYTGVSRDRRRNKWAAAIKKDGIPHNLGLFDNEEDAARAYDAAAWAMHHVYANLNFPQDYPDHPANRGRRTENRGPP
jgi:hypothetical protein